MAHTSDHAVFRRTRNGQTEVLLRKQALSDTESGLLMSVNGFTPVHVIAHLRRDGHELAQAAVRLLELGLIELVEESQQPSHFDWQPAAA